MQSSGSNTVSSEKYTARTLALIVFQFRAGFVCEVCPSFSFERAQFKDAAVTVSSSFFLLHVLTSGNFCAAGQGHGHLPSRNRLEEQTVLKERNPWLMPTESFESDETEDEGMTPLRHPPGLPDPLIEESCGQEPTPDRSVKAESRLLPTLNKGEVRGFRGDHNRQGQWQAREPDAPLDVELERWTKGR